MKTNLNHRLFIAIMVVGCLCFNVSAQQAQHTPEERAKALTDEMKSKLTLNDSQYQKVYDINLKYAKQNESIVKGTGDKKAKDELIKKQLDAKKQEMKGVLSADQYKKYESMREEVKSDLKDAKKEVKDQTKTAPK